MDTPTREELIAADESRKRPRLTEAELEEFDGKLDPRKRTVEEIRRYLGADSLGYVSIENMRRAVEDTRGTYCTSCYTGVYPVDGAQGRTRFSASITKSCWSRKFGWCRNERSSSEQRPAAAPNSRNGRAAANLQKSLWLREVLSWVWVILAFLLTMGTIVQARVIPSGSMENTLLVGDHLLMSRFGYEAVVPLTPLRVRLWREPYRQQIIVFRAPLPDNPDYIKRLIGMPGDQLGNSKKALPTSTVKNWMNCTAPTCPEKRITLDPVTIPPKELFYDGR